VLGPRSAAVIALVAVAGALVIACDTGKGPVFSAVFPAIDGDVNGSIDINALPVTLRDLTGSVTGIRTAEVRPEDHDFSRGRADPIPGQPNALRVLWLGGACERDVEMSLGQVEDELVLTVHANSSMSIFRGGCPALGVPRAVVIGFSRPVDPTPIDVRTDLDDEP
jgi:hypothetical protein